jgi:hypothetical protein
MAALPALIYDALSRIGNEAFVFYNLGKAISIGKITKTADGSAYTPELSCATTLVAPTGGFLVARVHKKDSATALVIVDGGGEDVDITIPAASTQGASFEMQDPAPALNTLEAGFVMTGGAVGDCVELLILPNPDDDVQICYDRGFTATPGVTQRAIVRKDNPVDHRVRQRPENTLSLTDLDVNNWVGVQALRDKEATIIVKVMPQNIGLPCQIRYYTQCMLNMPWEIPAEGNDSIQVAATGQFSKDCIFAAVPA